MDSQQDFELCGNPQQIFLLLQTLYLEMLHNVIININYQHLQNTYLNDLVGLHAVTSRVMQQSSGIRREPPPILDPIPARKSRPAFCMHRTYYKIVNCVSSMYDFTCNASTIFLPLVKSGECSLSHSI